MQKIVLFALALFLFFGITPGWAQDDIHAHPSCSYCGMDRAKFAHSRMYIEYDDGSMLGACSMHCAALDMAVNINKAPVHISVGDQGTKVLIDAQTAFWVLGGDLPGVMSMRATWAFKIQADAQKFIQQHGGDAVSFEQALEAVYAHMYQDTKMIRKKRQMMKMKNQ